MVPVDLIDGTVDLLHEHPANICFLRSTVPPLQRLRDGGMVIFPHFPQVRCSRAFDWACILHIKDIFQPGPAAAVLVDEGDALGAGFHPPPHGVIPQFHAGAGGGVRALGVDQKLVVKRIFV